MEEDVQLALHHPVPAIGRHVNVALVVHAGRVGVAAREKLGLVELDQRSLRSRPRAIRRVDAGAEEVGEHGRHAVVVAILDVKLAVGRSASGEFSDVVIGGDAVSRGQVIFQHHVVRINKVEVIFLHFFRC